MSSHESIKLLIFSHIFSAGYEKVIHRYRYDIFIRLYRSEGVSLGTVAKHVQLWSLHALYDWAVTQRKKYTQGNVSIKNKGIFSRLITRVEG